MALPGTGVSCPKLVGIREIAILARVNPSAVVNWRRRYKDFPEPVQVLRMGPIWLESAVVCWMDRNLGHPTQHRRTK